MADEVAQLRMNRRLDSRPTNVNPFAALHDFRGGSNNERRERRGGKGDDDDDDDLPAEQPRRKNGTRNQSPSLLGRMRNVVPTRSPVKDTFYTDRSQSMGTEQGKARSPRTSSYDEQRQRKQRRTSVTNDGQQHIPPSPSEEYEGSRPVSRAHGYHNRHVPERPTRQLHEAAQADHPYIKVRPDSAQSVMALRRKYVLPSSPSHDDFTYSDSAATSPSRPNTPVQVRGYSHRSPQQRSSSASYGVAHAHIGSQLGHEALLSSSADERGSTDLFYRGSQRETQTQQRSAMLPGVAQTSHVEEYKHDGLKSRFTSRHRGTTRSTSAASSVVSNSLMTITGKTREPHHSATSPRASPLPQWHSSSQGVSSANEDLNDSAAARKYTAVNDRSYSYKGRQENGAQDYAREKIAAQAGHSHRPASSGVLNRDTRHSIAAATAAQSQSPLPHPCWVCGRACHRGGYQQLPSIFVEVSQDDAGSNSVVNPILPLTLCSTCEQAVRDAAQSHNRVLCGTTESSTSAMRDVNTIASDAFRHCRLTRFSASCSSLFLHCVCRLVAWADVLHVDVKRSVQEEVADLLQYEMSSRKVSDSVAAAVEQSGITFPDLQADVQRILMQRLLQCVEGTFQLDALEHHREHDQELHIKRQEFFNSLKSGNSRKNWWGPEEWNAAANSSIMISSTTLPRSLTRREREMLVSVARSLSARVARASSALTTAGNGSRRRLSSAAESAEAQRHPQATYVQNPLGELEEEGAEGRSGTLRSGAAKRVVRFMMDDAAERRGPSGKSRIADHPRSNALQLQSQSALERLVDGYTSGYRTTDRQIRTQSDVENRMHEATLPLKTHQTPSQGEATLQELRTMKAHAAKNAERDSAGEVDEDPDNILLNYFEGRLQDLPRFAIPRYIPSPGATAFILSALMRGGGDSETENVAPSSTAESSTACLSVTGVTPKEMENVYPDLRSPVLSGPRRSPSPAGASPFIARAAGAGQRRPSTGDSVVTSPRNAMARDALLGTGSFAYRDGRSPSTEPLSPCRGWAEYSEIVISDESADEGNGGGIRSARGASMGERKASAHSQKITSARLAATPSSSMEYPYSLSGIVPEPEAAALVAIERARDEERRRTAAEDALRQAGERLRDLEVITNDAMEFHLRDHVHYTSTKLVELEKNFLNSASTFWMEAAMQKSLFFTDAVSSVTRRQEKSFLFERIDLPLLLLEDKDREGMAGSTKLIEAPPSTRKIEGNVLPLEDEGQSEDGGVNTPTNTGASALPRNSLSSSAPQPMQRITLKPLSTTQLGSSSSGGSGAAHLGTSDHHVPQQSQTGERHHSLTSHMTVEASSSSLSSVWGQSRATGKTTTTSAPTNPNGTLPPSTAFPSEYTTHQLETDTTIF